MKHLVYYYQDASHGWIKTTRSMLKTLKIDTEISDYSYQTRDGDSVYLEEDRDATLFERALIQNGLTLDTIVVDHGYSSPIRNYPKYENNKEK